MRVSPSIVAPVPASFNIARYCLDANDTRADTRIALTMCRPEGNRSYTWRDVRRRAAQWQQVFLKAALAPGDRVALCLPNSIDAPLALLAAAGLGAIPISLSPQLSNAELAYIFDDASPRFFVGHGPASSPGVLRIAAPVEEPIDADHCASHDVSVPPLVFADTRANTPAYMVYTSGTTGGPRGVVHAHRAVWARQMMREGWTGITAADRVLHAGQLNWTYAMGIAIFDAWSVGAHSILYEGPRTAQGWATLIRDHQATIFAAVPGVYRQILRDVPNVARSLQSLRHGLCAGEPLPSSVYHQWQDALGIPLYEALGMSECSTYISSGPATPTRVGSPGKAQPGRRVAILPFEGGEMPVPAGTSGLLCIHNEEPGLMLGYWRQPERTAAAFRGPWFITGDTAHFDADGYLWYEGRIDDIINAHGYRIGPTEVEDVLARHPAIRDVAVAGVELREGVRLLCAYIVEASPVEDDALKAWAAEALAAYKVPQLVRRLPALPRNRSGKVLRRALATAWDETQTP